MFFRKNKTKPDLSISPKIAGEARYAIKNYDADAWQKIIPSLHGDMMLDETDTFVTYLLKERARQISHIGANVRDFHKQVPEYNRIEPYTDSKKLYLLYDNFLQKLRLDKSLWPQNTFSSQTVRKMHHVYQPVSAMIENYITIETMLGNFLNEKAAHASKDNPTQTASFEKYMLHKFAANKDGQTPLDLYTKSTPDILHRTREISENFGKIINILDQPVTTKEYLEWKKDFQSTEFSWLKTHELTTEAAMECFGEDLPKPEEKIDRPIDPYIINLFKRLTGNDTSSGITSSEENIEDEILPEISFAKTSPVNEPLIKHNIEKQKKAIESFRLNAITSQPKVRQTRLIQELFYENYRAPEYEPPEPDYPEPEL